MFWGRTLCVFRRGLSHLLRIALLTHLTMQVCGYECWGPCKPKNNVPTFCDTIEGRCSLCTKPVCETFITIPPECTCFCVKEYPDRHYSEIEKNSCGDSEPSTDHEGKTTTKGDGPGQKQHRTNNALLVPVSVIASLLILVLICGLVYCLRHNIMNAWEKVCQPRRKIEQEVEIGPMLEVECLNSVLVTASQHPNNIQTGPHTSIDTVMRGSYNRIPRRTDRPSSVDSEDGDGTDPCGLRHVHAHDIGPQHPSEGVPADHGDITGSFQRVATC